MTALCQVWARYPKGHHRAVLLGRWHPWGGGEALDRDTAEVLAAAVRSLGADVEVRPWAKASADHQPTAPAPSPATPERDLGPLVRGLEAR
jgi:hypothetical protein